MTYSLNDKYLRTIPEKFDFDNPQVDPKELFENMKKTMISFSGYGLTCNQVGINLQMFVFGDSKNSEEILGLFNPKIVHYSDDTSENLESCLSIPKFVCQIKRSNSIRIRATNFEGFTDTVTFSGMSARIVQHEYSHLQGKLITDYISKLKYDMIKKKIEKGTFKT